MRPPSPSFLWFLLSLTYFIHPTLSAFTYWQPNANELSAPNSPFSITQPTELAGDFVFAHTSVGGPLWSATPTNDYHVDSRLLLPHSEDGLLGCSELTHSVTDEGDQLEGGILLLERGGCSFTDKLLNAVAVVGPNGNTISGVIVYGCSYSDGCMDELVLPAAFDFFPVPLVFITSKDGQVLKSYLLNRRQSYKTQTINGTLLQPLNCNSSINLMSSEAAMMNGCVLPGLEGFLIGTGELVDQNEIQGLQTLARAWSFDPSKYNDITWLRSWDDYLNSTDIDPCTSRITGLYCERGHVISIDVSALGITGIVPDGSLKYFTQLRYLLLPLNHFSGPLPNDLCSLTYLITGQFDSNFFTSLPVCMGGGVFPDPTPSASSSTYYPGMQSLVILSASSNLLTSLPASLGNLTVNLKILAMIQNQISQVFPVEYFQLKQLQEFEFYANANLTLDLDSLPPEASFQNFTSVNSILLRECNIYGHLPLDWFDGCTNLVTVDLSSNRISGSLPSFKDCNHLQTISLLNNQFEGGIPDEWKNLVHVTSINLQNNNLGGVPGNMNGLYSMTQLQYVYLSYNNVSGSVVDDIGESLFSLIGRNVIELFLDHNNFAGPWSNDGLWLPLNLRTLDLAYNRITNLPNDLWYEHLQYIDVSFNDLSGPLPDYQPWISSNSLTGQPPVRTFYIQGNPRFVVETLPTWLKFSSPPKYQLSTDGLYLCQQLVGISELLSINVDPTFTSYQGCQCTRGLFGVPPLCSLLPQAATVQPYGLPTSMEVGQDFINIINTTDYASMNSSFLQNTTFMAPFLQFPTAFTDDWYGENRFTTGMGTSWTIDLSNLLLPTSNLSMESSSPVMIYVDDSRFPRPDTSSLTAPYQSIRTIHVRVHLSRRDFSSDSILSIYAGKGLTGERVAVLSGNEYERIAALPQVTAFTSTPEYQQTYSSELSQLVDPVVLEFPPVFSSQATLLFASRSVSGKHFVASYSYSFACPDGYILLDPTTTSSFTPASAPTCVLPLLGTTSSVLILLLGIGGGLVGFVFIWLMYERYQRQKAQQVLRTTTTKRLSSHTDDVTAADIHSDEDLQSDADRLLLQAYAIAYQRLIREIMFEILTVLWELASTILNWIVVGQVLSEGTRALSSLLVGYIIVVIISTFAVGANTVSRIANFQFMKQQVEQEVVEQTKMKNNSESKGVHPSHELVVKSENEPLIRKRLDEIHRKLLRLKIHILSILLNALPFIILNLFTFYERDDITSSKSITVQASVLLSFLLVGMKIQELKEFPNQQRMLIQQQYELVQCKLSVLHHHPNLVHSSHSDIHSSHDLDVNSSTTCQPSTLPSPSTASNQQSELILIDRTTSTPHSTISRPVIKQDQNDTVDVELTIL